MEFRRGIEALRLALHDGAEPPPSPVNGNIFSTFRISAGVSTAEACALVRMLADAQWNPCPRCHGRCLKLSECPGMFATR